MASPHRRLAVLSRHAAVGASGGSSAAPRIGPSVAAAPLSRKEYNWGGNVAYGAASVALPRSLEELRAAVRDAPGEVRVVGRGHSFSPASSVPGGTLVSLARMSAVLQYEPPKGDGFFGSITFEGGATFNDLATYLVECSPPAALRQVPSPPFITVAGAVATGTHGSGIHNETIASHVTGVELVTADGSVVRYDREENPEEMRGVVLGLGCHGVVSKMTMQVVPWFDVRVFSFAMSLEDFIPMLDDFLGAGGRRPLCDSMSTLVSWSQGTVNVSAKHFAPHYDQSIAAQRPDYGARIDASRWYLRAPRKGDLSATAGGIGVLLQRDGSGVVAEVVPGSLASGTGIAPGWVLTHLGDAPAVAGNDGSAFQSNRIRVGSGADQAARAFASLPPQSIPGPFKPGREPKVMLAFKRPDGAAASAGIRASHAAAAWQAPWHDLLPVWPLGTACDPGPECDYGNQSEFFVPAGRAAEALRAVSSLARHWSRAETGKLESTGIHGSGELRCIKGDSAWISPCRDRDTLSIHLSWSGHPERLPEIQEKLLALEMALEPLDARFHWGKLHTARYYAPRVRELYGGGLERFRELARHLDPSGKFRSAWVRELLFGD